MKKEITTIGLIMGVLLIAAVVSIPMAAAAGEVTRTLPATADAGSTIVVSLAVTVDGATYYAIDEQVPAGWTVTSASDGGDFTSDPGHVKWVVTGSAVDKTYTYEVSIPATVSGSHTFSGTYMLEGMTEEANIGGDSSIIIKPPDTTAPTVITGAPTGTGVAVATTISATFSEAMNKAATEAAFSISPYVAGTFSWVGNTTTFTPGANLDNSKTYTVTISTDAQDLAGNQMVSPYTWSFTTSAAAGKKVGGGGRTVDSDGDGYSDSYEQRMGTDPNDPSSYPGAPVAAATPTPTAAAPTPTPTVTEAPTGTPEKVTPTPTEEPTPTPTKGPGFGAAFAVAGLLAVAYLVLRRKK